MIMVIKSLKKFIDPNVLVKHFWLVLVLLVFLVYYGPGILTRIPEGVKAVYNNILFRATILFVIVYMSYKDFTSALVLTLVFLITFNIVQSSNIVDKIETFKEGYENIYGQPVAECNAYDTSKVNEIGTLFYPLNDKKNEIEM